MDKRTLIFVISLGLTLLFVNMFFENRNQGAAREQFEHYKAQQILKIENLKNEIEQDTAKAENLSIEELYEDQNDTTWLASGILSGNGCIALQWTDSPPKRVFIKKQEYQLTYSGKDNSPIVYAKTASDKLTIGTLPFFGTYELQLVQFAARKPSITLGKFVDGQFSIPALTVNNLNKELEIKESEASKPGDSLVLMKSGEHYFPVAVYDSKTNSLTPLEQLADLPFKLEMPGGEQSAKNVQEQFFVLENGYQQLVFTNRGGALAEINLPFETDKNKKSVVREIGFDRDIMESHPYDAFFPSHAYFTPGEKSGGPFTENSKGHFGGYYPLIRRDFLLAGKQKSIQILPEFYALNIVSEYPEMAELHYKVTHFDSQSIVFEAKQRNRTITKTYSFKEDDKEAPYCFDLTIKIEGESKGLWLTSGIPEVEIISNAAAPVMKYRITRKGKPEVNTIDNPAEMTTVSDIYPDWVCNSNGFLGLILDPLTQIDPGFRAQHISGNIAPSRLMLIDSEHERYKAADLPGYMLLLPLNSKGGTMKFRILAGPFASNILKNVDAVYSDPKTGYNPDYIATQSFHGWFSFISAPFAKFLLILLDFFHNLTRSWAFSIVLLTIALRLMLYPLNAWSTKSMLKMQQIAPEVKRIQEKYKKEPQKAQLQIMNLYRENGVNPVSGCLPLLIQMPFLIGMFDLLKSTFELRGASFIPGWIDNLAAPDVLFSWHTPIFFIGNQFHLLPFLLGAVMFIQQRVSSPMPKDVSQLTDQQRQQRAMGTMMTLVFTVMFYHFPSGLNIYWLSSMILGIFQQLWTQKKFKKLKAAPEIIVIDKKRKDKKG